MATDLERQLVVRKLAEADIPAVVPLLQATFGSWPKVPTAATPLEHLRWKLGNGRPGHQSHYVAEVRGQLVAFQGNLHWQMKVGHKVLIARRGWDAAVHPEWQGRGVMSVMRPAMHENFDVVPDMFLGSSAHAAMDHLYESEDRRPFAHEWIVHIRPLTVRAALRTFKLRPGRRFKRLRRAATTLARWVAVELWQRISPRSKSVEIRTVDRFDDKIDAFFLEASRDFDFISVRTKELLNWRYADDRAGAFTIRVAYDGPDIVGYSVLRVANGTGHVADLLGLPGRPDVIASLARDAALQLRGVAPVIECWLFENSPYVAPMRASGFLGRRRRRQVTYRAVGVPLTEVEFLSDKATRVHLSLGDMDYV